MKLVLNNCFHLIRTILMVLAMVAITHAAPNDKSANPSTEYRVKAAFLLSFPKFIEWPADTFESTTAPWRIGVLNSPEMVQILNASSDKKVRGRSFEIHAIEELKAGQVFHVLFVGNINNQNTNNIEELDASLSGYSHSPTLVVSEDKESFAVGGVINFFLERGKTRFEIHTKAARERNLVIGASLLRVASLVED